VITIRELVGRTDLALSFLAGAEGGQRIVTWAHAVDLPDPWHWVRQGDLVMTTGAGLPSDAKEQESWIARLADANTSGLVLAPRPDAPALTAAALGAAEDRRFPVLGASFDLEFARLARVVIESALESQRHRLANSERLFSAYAGSLRQGHTLTERLGALGRRFGWHLEVCVGDDVLPAGRTTGSMDNSSEPVRMAIPGRTPATLVVRPRDASKVDDIVDPLLVHYLSGLIGVELEREAIERDHARTSGAAILRGVLDGSMDHASARAAFERRGLTGPMVVLALRPSGPAATPVQDLHHLPALHAAAAPLLEIDDVLLMVVPEQDDLVETIRRAVGEGSRVGVSPSINAATGIVEGFRQARLALAQAEDGDALRVTYAAARPVTLLPDTVAEAAAIAYRYLGPLLDYDRSHGTELVATIEAFLSSDGSWKRTSERLHIHRQTLVYRLKTVEQLTGLKPTSTLGTASLWLALQAGHAAGIVGQRA
jgi:purine catabolism regulator